jgi:hypothetical protein
LADVDAESWMKKDEKLSQAVIVKIITFARRSLISFGRCQNDKGN